MSATDDRLTNLWENMLRVAARELGTRELAYGLTRRDGGGWVAFVRRALSHLATPLSTFGTWAPMWVFILLGAHAQN